MRYATSRSTASARVIPLTRMFFDKVDEHFAVALQHVGSTPRVIR
jgi:hypothetical protein